VSPAGFFTVQARTVKITTPQGEREYANVRVTKTSNGELLIDKDDQRQPDVAWFSPPWQAEFL
jgi:hypothetical protein